jgi:5-methylcytosine-specific restriction endonuclease McrA
MPRIGRDYRYRQVRDRVLSGASVCHLCGRPLDFDADPRSRWAPSVDHLLPVSRTVGLDDATRQRLAVDPEGLVPAHVGCNSARGNRRRRQRHISRSWT